MIYWVTCDALFWIGYAAVLVSCILRTTQGQDKPKYLCLAQSPRCNVLHDISPSRLCSPEIWDFASVSILGTAFTDPFFL